MVQVLLVFLGSMFVLFISVVSPFIRELQLYLFFCLLYCCYFMIYIISLGNIGIKVIPKFLFFLPSITNKVNCKAKTGQW